MEQSRPNVLWSDRALTLTKTFLKTKKVPFLSALGVGLLTYMFTLTNKLVNFDDVYCLFSRGGTLESGRWGLYLIWRFLPSLSMPWLHGIATVLLLSISACVIIDALQIRNCFAQGFAAALFISFPSMVGIVTYMFDASAYAVAVLLATVSLSAGLRASDEICSDQRNLLRCIMRLLLAMGCCVLSLSIYQAFFLLTAGLCLTELLGRLLVHREKAGLVLRRGFLLLGFLLFSFLVYFLILRFFWWRHHFSGGNYMAAMTDTGSLSVPALILRTYQLLPDVVLHGAYGLVATKMSRLAHIVLLAFLVTRLVFLTIRTRCPASILLAVLLALLLPVGVGAIILVSGDNVHSLVFFSFTAYYFLAGLLLDEQITNLKLLQTRITCNIVTVALFVLVLNSVYVGNSAFLKLHMAYENSYAFYSSIVTQVKSVPELKPDSKLAIIGKSDLFVNDFSQFPASDGIMGATGFEVNDYSYDRFIKYYIGFDMEFANKDELERITLSEEFKEMPVYPFAGSIRVFNDIVVVKLSAPTASPQPTQ